MADEKPKDPLLHLYVDESGSRHPDKPGTQAKHGNDWFAVGGILIKDEDLITVRQAIANFKKQWPKIKAPLHFTDMRAKKKNFAWLGTLEQKELNHFWSTYRTFLAEMPVSGTACVIDRPGYIARGYGKREGDAKWLLCRSAFDILLERSAKLARMQGRRLNVNFEMADPGTNQRVKSYYINLKYNGLAFDEKNSAKYEPMTAEQFAYTLLTIEGKDKTSTVMQVADSYIYAIARGSYEPGYDVYDRIARAGRLITDQVPAEKAAILGIKTYCFDQGKAS
jgi:hypothetical protein